MASTQARQDTYQAKIAEGRGHLAHGSVAPALSAFHAAAGLAPDEPEPLLLIAEANRQAGRYGAAILALKQAEALAPGNDAVLQKQLADLYRRDGHPEQAIATLVVLRDAGRLLDPEILMLARLQARERDTDGAFQTLERIQRDRPDDIEAKLVEAEILLMKGEELLAARLMDRMVEQSPGLTAARLLRARYFLNSGYPEEAQKDLARVPEADVNKSEVVTLRARVLTTLGQHTEAEAMLSRVVEENPRDPDTMAQLAEVKLNLAKYEDAQGLVDKVLKMRPQFGRALYVRARTQEQQGRFKDAEESYRYALTAEPGFAPALSRMWRLHQKAGRNEEAVSALETLYFTGEASAEEKVALVELYVDTKRQLDRARKLLDEALRREPGNAQYLSLKDRLDKLTNIVKPKKRKSTGLIIMRGGR